MTSREIEKIIQEGEEYALQGDLVRARERFQEILDHDGAHIEALNNMGVLCHRQGLHEQAISYLERALAVDEAHALTVENLANCYVSGKEYRKAADLLQRPWKRGIMTPRLLSIAAKAFLELGDRAAAVELLRQSWRLDPSQSDVGDLLTDLDSHLPNPPESHRDPGEKVARVGFVTLWYERGHAYVTKMMRDALSPAFETFVFARNGGSPDLRLLSTEGEWAVPRLTTCRDYMIPQKDFVRWVIQNRLDVVVFNEEYHLRLVRAAREAGARTIGYYVWELFPTQFAAKCNELYDQILCQTDVCYRHFSQLGLKNLLRIPWGIDRNLFFAGSLESHGPVCFFHPAGWGGMHERRSSREVIEAFKAANITGARLIIHTQEGSGKEENGPITILHGTVPREKLASLYRNADVAVLPSKWEGLGLTFLESVGCGLPIITVDAPPMSEFVKNGETGFLCRVKSWEVYPDIFIKAACVDVDDMASKMKRIMDPEVRGRMKKASRDLAAHYRYETFQMALTDAVLGVVSGKTVRLNLGCGDDHREGYINVDLRPRKGVGLVADAASCPFRDRIATEILANDILEHFPRDRINQVLSEWRRLLMKGGTLKVQCPDLRELARGLVLNRLPVQEFSRRVYGGQDYEGNYHFAGFDLPDLKRRLRSLGFEIREIGSSNANQAITARVPGQIKKGPLRILLISARFTNHPWGTGNFIHRALTGLGHQVLDIDFRRDHDRMETLFQEPVDLVLAYKGSGIPPRLLEKKSCPSVLWYPDDVLTQDHALQDLRQTGYAYDHIYYFDQAGVPFLHRMGLTHSTFLPLATDPLTYRYIPDTPKRYDISFIGTVYPNRRALLDRLKSRFNVFETTAYMDDMARVMNQSRIVLNLGVGRSGYQLRVFEALGCRAFLLTNEIEESERIFKDREHLVYFNDENIEERIAYYLGHAEEREAIAEAGYREVLAKHTFEARGREILSNLQPPATHAMDMEIAASAPTGTAARPRRSSGFTASTSKTLSREVYPCTRRLARPLRIVAAFTHFNWEDHNLQPALQEFGDVVRLRWPPYNQYADDWHSSGKQEFNHRLLQEVKRARDEAPVDLFFSYLSGRLVFPSTIRAIGVMGIPTVNIFLDDRHKFYGKLEPTGFAGMVDIAGSFRLCCTSSEQALRHYHSVGARALHLPEGANPDVYRPLDVPKDIDVSFVGQRYGRRGDTVDYLKSKGIRVETYGRGWPSGEIAQDEMVKIFSRSRINLGFAQAGEGRDVFCLKGRDFEIPMSGGLYLTQHHGELEKVYDIGREIVCYRDREDLAEKIQYYLRHPEEAELIRISGRRRALRDHTWAGRLRKAFQAVGLDAFPSNLPDSGNAGEGKRRSPYDPLVRESFARAVSLEGAGSRPRTPCSTADDETYYARVGQESAKSKQGAIRDFILSRKDIRYLLDVGCNTGEMSAQFIPHGIQVLGLDVSDRLRSRSGYSFLRRDVTDTTEVLLSDCTLFLSLYHHVLWSKGIQSADTLFYQLLMRSKYLLFDCGNVLETSPYRQRWVRSLLRHFSSERDLLDHFGIPYRVLGSWETGGATRSIVVFERESFDRQVQVVDEFRRKCGSPAQKEGLFPLNQVDDTESFFDKTVFYRLRLAGRDFYAKKHIPQEWETSEIRNLMEVYDRFPPEELLTFYGLSERFGLIYEWVNDLRYVGKVRDEWVHGLLLQDADRIEVNGKIKYIDFWSDPAKRSAAVSPPPGNGSVEDLIREGEAAYAAGDPKKAVELFQKVLARQPDHFEAMNDLGVIACEKGDLDPAISLFLQAHRIRPSHADAVENIGRCHELKGDYHEALKWYRKILDSGTASVETLNRTGNCFMQTEDLDGAREIYKESLRRDGSQEGIRTLLRGIETLKSLQPPPRGDSREVTPAGSGAKP
jgi:spore maturation protein CgeB/tetratricopeptide (TPR) repeat protein